MSKLANGNIGYTKRTSCCICKSQFFLGFPSFSLFDYWFLVRRTISFIKILHTFFQIILNWISTYFILTFNLTKIYSFLQFSIDPVTLANNLVIDVVGSHTHNLSILELPNILTIIREEEIAFSMFFQVSNLSIINFSIWILNFSFINNTIIFPFSTNNFT